MKQAVTAEQRTRTTWEQVEGSDHPRGAVFIEKDATINFAIYSKHASNVRLLLFTADEVSVPCLKLDFDYLKNKTGPVWHCRLSMDDIGDARYYGYQVDGPSPAEGFLWHFFDSEKLLLDPFAKVIYFPPEFNRHAASEPGSNLGRAPLGILPHHLECAFDWQGQQKPRHDHDLVIYEMHVKGFTANPNSGIEEEKRGTFAGVIEKIPYLVELGVTAVELMPVFQFDPQDDNYWGYMPLSFFAPHSEYATVGDNCDPLKEFREMVRALHAAGIEVILDVVYNHTCEQGLDGPTYSFKGIDNSTYYMLDPNANDPFVNFSGTGNTLHTINASTRQLIINIGRWKCKSMGFDLISLLFLLDFPMERLTRKTRRSSAKSIPKTNWMRFASSLSRGMQRAHTSWGANFRVTCGCSGIPIIATRFRDLFEATKAWLQI